MSYSLNESEKKGSVSKYKHFIRNTRILYTMKKGQIFIIFVNIFNYFQMTISQVNVLYSLNESV